MLHHGDSWHHALVVGHAERVASGRLSRKLEAQLESEREIEPASIKAALSSTGRDGLPMVSHALRLDNGPHFALSR